MLKAAMSRPFSAALVLALLAASPLLAQYSPLSLCLVQTKPDSATQYTPSAGPWAIELYKVLSAQKLTSDAPLQITVLAALQEKDVLPEVRRLQCLYTVQLWYQRSIWPKGAGRTMDDGDSLLFSLWNSTTGKVIAHGASPIRLIHPGGVRSPDPLVPEPGPCVVLTQQIMKSLNKLP
jgi:hypothetical protein